MLELLFTKHSKQLALQQQASVMSSFEIKELPFEKLCVDLWRCLEPPGSDYEL